MLPTSLAPSPDLPAAAPRRSRARLALLGAALLAAVAGCTEDLETTAVCPELCEGQSIDVEEVVLQPVVLDTTLAPFPLFGEEPYLLVASAGDTLDTRLVVRFDTLPQNYVTTVGGTDSVTITQVLQPRVRLTYNPRISQLGGPVTLQAYDVTGAASDTVTSDILPLFTPARLLGSVTVQPRAATDSTTVDSISVPIDPARLLAKIQGGERLRLGFRVQGADPARLRLLRSATLIFRAVADTAVPAVQVNPSSATPTADDALRNTLRGYVVVAAGTVPPPGPVLTVGGMPARRVLMRFALPSDVLDSASIVRATLELTQRPVRGYPASDTLTLTPLPVTASSVVTDVDRLARLATNPSAGGGQVQLIPPVRVVPGDSGIVRIELANVVGLWSARSGSLFQPTIVLSTSLEGASLLQASFFSTEAAASLRPTLRLRFIRRVNFDLP